MGRRITKPTDFAYIAGFLDGDGSIMVQIKNRYDTPTGWRLMFTICFYQDSRHKTYLEWIREKLHIGYLSDRKDGISELRINGQKQIKEILSQIKPFIKFKLKQVRITLKILNLIKETRLPQLKKEARLEIADLICDLRNENYFSSKRKYNKKELKKILSF